MKLGIVGLPNVGKSTLFNAITNAGAESANYPFCTIEPNKATVEVPDKRIDTLSVKISPLKTIHAHVDFIDIAGLVQGASKGEGLGNKFLANIRDCAVLVHVARCFEDENISHVNNVIDPIKDIETVDTELLLADLQTVEKRIEKLQKTAKFDKNAKSAVDCLHDLLEFLNCGQRAAEFTLPENELFKTIWKEIGLLSAKPVILCANVDEQSVSGGNVFSESVKKLAEMRQSGFACICAKLEEELQGLPKEDQAELLSSFGIKQSGLERIIRTGYDMLGLCSFFTAGHDEVRAWTIRKGCRAPQAAGVIHSDFERGFIRAEVIAYKDYIAYENEAACRAAAVLRTEGKDYIVHDGDIMHFLFNV